MVKLFCHSYCEAILFSSQNSASLNRLGNCDKKPRKPDWQSFDLEIDMKLISLSQGKFAKVDDGWFDYLNQWKWFYANGYAQRHTSSKLGKRKLIGMQNVIYPPPEGMVVDHKDTDGLNNQATNLRHATCSQNGYNRKKDCDNSTGYKGVVKIKPSKKWKNPGNRWRASIKVNGKTFCLGTYSNPIDAALAYDDSARRNFGEFAKTNF